MKNNRYHINHTTKIAQLADQAHEECNIIYCDQLKTNKADQVIFYDIFNQRLAELILKECLDVIDSSVDLSQASNIIKKRFNYPLQHQGDSNERPAS